MQNKTFNFLYLLLIAIFIASCSTQKPTTQKPTTTKPAPKPTTNNQQPTTKLVLPGVNREFRAAWVATVANINWPSKNNLSTEQQKSEAIAILDMLKDANFNAVIFQARPSADALYKSDLEPWSYYLTGNAGTPPSPYYDPLEFWISEAHKRGMALHVWLNPYRAHHTAGGPVTSASMASKMNRQTVRLKNGMYWMDPSDQEVQDHASAVIKDLVKRYDIDAVHIDDYFYPYREYNGGADFPDGRSWSAYTKGGGTLSKADWRRANVNKFIKRIYDEIKAEKPSVMFGISPFGIWKPGYPAGITGSSQYDELFADAKLWLNEGWVDYFSPQLYWKTGGAQDYNALLAWWQSENTKSRHLWPGLNTVGLRGVADRPAAIAEQIESTRNLLKDKAGEVHYSTDGLAKSYEMLNAVKKKYSNKALVPMSPWIKAEPLAKPQLTVKPSAGNFSLSWTHPLAEKAFHWVLYTEYGNDFSYEILDNAQRSQTVPATKNSKKLKTIAVTAVDRLGNESDYSAWFGK